MKKLGLLFTLSALLLLVRVNPLQAVTPTASGMEFVDVLIGFKLTPGPVEETIIQKAGGKIKYSYQLVPAIAAKVPSRALQGLSHNPLITVIEPDGVIYASDYTSELDNTWGVKHVQSGVVHQTGNLGKGVKVAVIDSGIEYTHPELAPHYIGGYDYVNQDNDPFDDNGHGTHVAGTIAAARNGAGVVGVSPEANLFALKVLSASGSGNWSNVIAALQWAVENGIQITNNSYGSSTNPGTLVQEAFSASYTAGLLHIASAGNEGNTSGRGDSVGYPAKFDTVIAVAATDQNNQRAKFSSTGPAVELSAPGVSINSTWINNTYRLASGTSMASPHVTGVAALVMTQDLTNVQVRSILQSSATSLGNPLHYGFGLVNAAAALNQEVQPEDPTVSPTPTPAPEKCSPGLQKQGRC